jgi:methyl acetate hydrolase
MSNEALKESIDAILERVTTSDLCVPGVIAVITNREGDLYADSAGVRTLGEEQAMTNDTTLRIASVTKAITGTACLQLVEDGRLDLDAPAKHHAPGLAKVQVLEGFGPDGSPQLRPPKRDMTTRNLLLHTAGFAYDFCNESYARLAREHGQVSVSAASRAALDTPILFDPGEQWEYGTSIDWAGQVVEGITGRRLGEVMQDQILDPLGMTDTAFTMSSSMRERMAKIHQRADDGSLIPLDLVPPQDPEVHMGGSGLYSTALDYSKFIRMWLNDGAGPSGQVLRPETVRMAETNGLGEMKIKGLPGINPAQSNYAEFFPGMSKSWGLTFMINDEDAPTGRPAGCLAWAGMFNLFYWIDRRNGVGGFWATQILPFFDRTSLGGYLDMETATYQSLC